jgi:hypothetical protein
MASSNLNLNQILFKSKLRSKPVEENFSDIETNYNALRAEFQAGVASTVTEITNARDYESSLQDNIHSRRVYNDRVAEPGDYLISQQGTPDMTVSAAAGSGIVNGVGVFTSASFDSGTIATAASGNKRKDAVIISSANALSIKTGAEISNASAFQFPNIATGEMLLSHINVYNTTTAITTAHLDDRRVIAENPFDGAYWRNSNYNYTGNTLTNYELESQKGNLVQVNVNYSGDTVSTIGATINTIRYTQNFSYSGGTLIDYKLKLS